MRKKRLPALLSALVLMMLPALACAATPYTTYTMNGYGDVQETQTAYLAVRTITKFGTETFDTPDDLFVAEDGTIYVADTKHKRILVGNADGDLLGIVGKGTLTTPRGVFVTKNGHIYVADRDEKAVFEFSPEGELLNTYGKPDSPLYGDEKMSFMPLKVVVNDAGIMFVVCESNTNGIAEISPIDGGTFLGYFGTNFASADFRTVLYRAILTKEQRAKMVSNIPKTPDNLAIDERGLIYTITRGDESKTVKRLNIAGLNLIESAEKVDIPAAVSAGNHNNLYVADQKGFIYEFNNDGELIFVFGGKDDGNMRMGLFTTVSAIDVDTADRLYVLDSTKNAIQVFKPTEFTDLLHEALYLFSVGRYTESREPLRKVLDMNSLFDVANRAMGRACFQEEKYDEALRFARLAKDREGYSDAYWEIRNTWLKRNVAGMLGLIIVAFVLIRILKAVDRKKGIFAPVRKVLGRKKPNGLRDNLGYAFHYMRHPVDASYGIAREGRASWLSSSVLLVVFILEFLASKYLCGFLQKTIQDGRYEMLSDVGMLLAVVLGLTLCHYLVCTINDGEGRVKQIFTYFCYSLTPYIVLTPVAFLLSHVLTLNEQFLMTFIRFVTIGWMAVLIIIGIREVNNYTGKETAKVIFLTIFTVLIMALIIFILYILWAQVIEFISAIIGEAGYRMSGS